MSSTLLDSLYDEYEELKEKLNLVRTLIVKYGGEIPSDEAILKTQKLIGDSTPMEEEAYRYLEYPATGTWKEKITSVLRYHKTYMMTTKEIAAFIYNQDIALDIKSEYSHVHNMVTQIASSMGRNRELGVDNSGFRNKYYLDTEEVDTDEKYEEEEDF